MGWGELYPLGVELPAAALGKFIMKNFITAAAFSIGISAVAAPAVAPELEMTKALKIYPQVTLLQRGAPEVVVGLKVQVGLSNGCKKFAGFWFQSNKATEGVEGVGFVAPAQQLQFAVSQLTHPSRPCTEVYKMHDVIVPIRLARGDEDSSAQTLFSVAGLGSYSVAYDWKTGKASVQKVVTLE